MTYSQFVVFFIYVSILQPQLKLLKSTTKKDVVSLHICIVHINFK